MIKKIFFLLLLMLTPLIPMGCSVQPASFGRTETSGRFDRAEKYGQFIPVNTAVDCKGTKVTIEKLFLDKTGTFMIASVDGDIRGNMDYLSVELFDDQGLELGRSTFLQKLPDGKTLLTFGAVQTVPKALRMEFFGGPVGYGSGHVVLDLKGISFKVVDKKYIREYRLAETVNKPGYRLLVDEIATGISQARLHYKLTASGNYDGIKHGWFYDWRNNYSPEGEILSMFDGGWKLGVHLSGINCLGPYYRVSQDEKTMVGSAKFDPVETSSIKVSLSNIYGYYNMKEIIPINGVMNRLDINRRVSVRGYTVNLKSFFKENGENWILDYSVLDFAGNPVDAAIEAWLYWDRSHNVPMSIFNRFRDQSGGDRRLVLRWQPQEGSGNNENLEPVIKITRLGIRQEDAVLDINLDNSKKPWENQDETGIMSAVNDYYNTFGNALANGDVTVFEKKYGYLKPTGVEWDGINDWRRHFDVWSPLGVQEYTFSLNDPIITVSGNTATADIEGFEKIMRKGGHSAGGFCTVFYLEKVKGKWKIIRVDESTEAELHGP